MGLKMPLEQKNKWKNDVIAVLLLGSFAFFINRGIEIKGLYMDDLYLWSCYGEQSFLEFNFPMGSTRFRFLYYLMAWLELAFVGNRVEWFVPINILFNILVSAQVYWFGTKLSGSRGSGFIAGILYLLSRMSYYQISQVYGLMETAATAMALGILMLLYFQINEKRTDRGFYGACILYFSVCFVHERYMALLPLLWLALVLSLKKGQKFNWKKWAAPFASFGAVMGIRWFTIGSVLPAGTGGTQVADTFSIKKAVWHALCQVGYVFGCNAGPEHLNGMSWQDSPRWIKLFVILSNLVLLALLVAFLVKMIRTRKKFPVYLKNILLFLTFIALCIGASSVTIRIEMRWVYVSYTAALLFLCYILGVLREPGECGEERRHNSQRIFNTTACTGVLFLYFLLTLPAETFYREKYPNLYFWPNQLRYNSLAEETYERYGDEIFGKTIYIIGNSYEMSEFTADTFFKVFDKERKAEGTRIEFIDSILQVGQVKENMLILREDPKHNRFQDITAVVQSLKCEIINGYYRDGWMDEHAKIRVMAGAQGLIRLKFMFPGILNGGETTTIYVDGKLAAEIPVTESIYYQEIEAEPYQIVELKFEHNFYMQNAQEKRGEDKLAVIAEIEAD